MRYMLLISPTALRGRSTPSPSSTSTSGSRDGRARIRSIGERLAPPADGTTVRVRNGKVLLTNGPFVETKEIICGFDLIECSDLDEAIEVARKHPMATYGMIEVRPFWTQPPPS